MLPRLPSSDEPLRQRGCVGDCLHGRLLVRVRVRVRIRVRVRARVRVRVRARVRVRVRVKGAP